MQHLRLDSNRDPQTTSWLRGLPLLPQSHSPDSLRWVNSMAICAIMKEENVEDVLEWLRYYKCASKPLVTALGVTAGTLLRAAQAHVHLTKRN
jgi:hypothetical protein